MEPTTPGPDLAELKFRTFAELLETWAHEHGPDVILHLLSDSNPNKSLDVTYQDLFDRARAKAAALQERGVRQGEKVVLVLPTGIEFVACFFGAVLAGAVPVPAYPPFGLGKLDEYLDRLVGIVTDSQAVAVCTTRAVFGVIGQALGRMPALRDVFVAAQLTGDAARFTPVALAAEDTVLLQYTSGSTGTQKGVELSHRNILSNLHGIGLGVECREGLDVGACWLPLCHDMGLIGCLLWCCYWRVALVLMSPQSFIGDPKRWLWAIHKYQVTLSPAPNFAYDICARRIPEAEVAGLDLSSWRVAFNGAEPVSFISLDAFSARFDAHGFRRTALFPVYGLAEDSLAAAFPVPGADVVIDVIDRGTLETERRAVPANGGGAQRMVSVGRPLWGAELRIVDEAGHELPERRVGELLIRGPSVMKGYYRNPEATAQALQDGWLHTGDLAYLAAGQLYITGRIKDLIIKRGRNYYPHDLERAVERLPGVRTGCTVAFSVPNEAEGTEDVVLLVETRVTEPAAEQALRAEIDRALLAATGIRADVLRLLPPHTLPKTTSGKIQRRKARALHAANGLKSEARAGVWYAVRAVGKSLIELARFERRRRQGRDA